MFGPPRNDTREEWTFDELKLYLNEYFDITIQTGINTIRMSMVFM